MSVQLLAVIKEEKPNLITTRKNVGMYSWIIYGMKIRLIFLQEK